MRRCVLAGNLRAQFSRHVAEVGVTNLFLLFMQAVITFYPLFFVGFTTYDDATIAINFGNAHGDIWETTKIFCERQGRFAYLWNYPLSQIPYAVDSRIWYLAMKYGSFFLLLSALYYAVFKSFRSSWIALASLMFFLAFIQNGWDHNALTSFPFGVNLFAALFLVSLGLFSTAIARKNLALAGLSGVLYFFALYNELFVLFFPFYVAILLSQTLPGESAIRQIMSGKKYILAISLPLMVYLAIYMAWRSFHPTSYVGNSLDGFNLLAAGKVIATYSLSAFPLVSLQFIISPGDQLLFLNSSGLRVILSELNAVHFIKPAVAGFFVARLMTTAHFIAPQTRTLIIGANLSFVGIFLPNLLLGFTQKYQSWVASGSYSYLYTYHSFISAVVFAALVLAYMNAKSRSWRPKLRLALVLIMIIVIMAISFAVEVRNQYIAFDQKLSHRKWQLMDVVIRSQAFMEIPDGSSVVAPTLTDHHRGVAFAFADYWSKYTKYKTNKKVQFVDDKCNSGVPCYSLVFRQESHSDNQFIVLAKIKNPDLLDSSEMTIYSMPNQASAVLLGSFVADDVSPEIVMNGVPVANVGAELFSLNLPHVPGEGPVQTAKVTGNIDILQDRITISHYSVMPRLRSFSAELADGIDFKKQGYPDFLAEVSGMSGYEQWGCWTDATAGPVAKFRFKQALPRQFTLEITSIAIGPNYGAPVKVRVGGVEKTFIITSPKKEIDTYRLEFETDGSADTLEITPPNPICPNEIDSKNSDTRKLGIGFISLKIKG